METSFRKIKHLSTSDTELIFQSKEDVLLVEALIRHYNKGDIRLRKKFSYVLDGDKDE